MYAAHCFVAERLNLDRMVQPPGLGEVGWWMECRLAQLDESRWVRGLRRVQLADGSEVMMSKQVLAARRILTGYPYPVVSSQVYVPPELLGLWRSGSFPPQPSPVSSGNFSDVGVASADGGLLLGPLSSEEARLAPDAGPLPADLQHVPTRSVPSGLLPAGSRVDPEDRAVHRSRLSRGANTRQDSSLINLFSARKKGNARIACTKRKKRGRAPQCQKKKERTCRTSALRAAIMAGAGWTGDHISIGYDHEIIDAGLEHLLEVWRNVEPFLIVLWGVITYPERCLQLLDRDQALYRWPLARTLRAACWWGPHGENRAYHISFGW